MFSAVYVVLLFVGSTIAQTQEEIDKVTSLQNVHSRTDAYLESLAGIAESSTIINQISAYVTFSNQSTTLTQAIEAMEFNLTLTARSRQRRPVGSAATIRAAWKQQATTTINAFIALLNQYISGQREYYNADEETINGIKDQILAATIKVINDINTDAYIRDDYKRGNCPIFEQFVSVIEMFQGAQVANNFRTNYGTTQE